ncbi:MAG TPA: GAF domain-containing protein [Candidatus Dormibacteraeota bacterium]|nr:GAF domain-containing protein [Candidatus Dormibacteraeota bacterium]
MTIDPTAGQRLAELHTALASAPPGVQSILSSATSTLSRLVPGTWMALVMDPNPETSRVVVADDPDRTMAAYVDTFIAAIDRPNRAPTMGLSQQVIESGNPIFRRAMAIDDLVSVLSSAGQSFMRSNPPPGGGREVDFLMVPMRVGGATVGTLSVADWKHRDVVTESDVEWVQAAADRIALSVELARLADAVQNDALRLDLVRSIGLAFRQRQDVGLVTRVVVEQITSRLDVDAADILLLAEGANEMVLQATAGFRSSLPAGSRIAIATLGLNGDWEPRVQHLAEFDRHGHNPRGTHFAREGLQTLVTVKLHARNRLLGLLELYNRSVMEWDQAWLDFFDTLGVLVGVAIDQSGATTEEARERAGRAPRPDFSALELDILRLIVEGLTNREIAEQVHRSENTIKFHVRRILERTAVSNRTELARRATREGWL